jgi:4,5-DOPA dioxygenase extradiol
MTQSGEQKIESRKFPVAFVGHGTPQNAIDDNAFTRGWAALATRFPRPRAILCVSAHWYTRGEGPKPAPRVAYEIA